MRTERTIRNCTVRVKTPCPRTWDDLTPTSEPSVRHCGECGKDVYFCATDAETIDHARAGHCIAREEPHRSELSRLIVGRATVSAEPTERQRRALELRRREHGITLLVNSGRLQGATRPCPECSYPVPGFRKSCCVCGFEVGRA
jgi:hypothetical protein